MRRSIYNRILAVPFGKLNLDGIKPVALGELLDRVKSERGPGPAVHARELVLQVYRFAAGKGAEVDNPAEALARKAYATFVPREHNLGRHEIQALLDGLEQTGTAPTLRLACWRRRRNQPCAGFAVNRLERTEIPARRRLQLVRPGSVAVGQVAQIGVGSNS